MDCVICRVRSGCPEHPNGVPTQVYVIQGKKANQAFRTAREVWWAQKAVDENKENIPPDDEKADPERHDREKAG